MLKASAAQIPKKGNKSVPAPPSYLKGMRKSTAFAIENQQETRVECEGLAGEYGAPSAGEPCAKSRVQQAQTISQNFASKNTAPFLAAREIFMNYSVGLALALRAIICYLHCAR
jgi:hypothetical protein